MNLEHQNSEKLKRLFEVLKKYWLLLFYITSIIYLELIYALWNFHSVGADFIFPVIFALCAGVVLFVISSSFKVEVSRYIAIAAAVILTTGYVIQMIYYAIFRTPLSLYSLSGADDAMQFASVLSSVILKNSVVLILAFLPLILLFMLIKRMTIEKLDSSVLYLWLIFCLVSYEISIISVNLTGDKAVSQRAVYYEASSPELSVIKLGVLTTMRLDMQRLAFGFQQEDYATAVFNTNTGEQLEGSAVEEPAIEEIIEPENYNIMDIDFGALAANEEDEVLRDMHGYFSKVEPTKQNEYTGMFKGNNLIMMTAEGFSPHAISRELTPTLYKLSKEGFVLNNFYNPLWGVSTSDGEYVACTGLIPKSGIWSFYRSGKNHMPFVMGNQFKKLGYITKAYHNHSYTYYKRNISHPNMGYEYKGVGNGLKVKKTWPESDLEMIDVTAEEYINDQPFHAYYMTVSGHMEYNFDGNYIAKKNKELVKELGYSDPARAYIACNLELEFALKSLIEKLEAAGIAENTVIAISADHYPYGLPKESIDELAGHQVEENFELYKSTLILWKKGMEPVIIEKPCSSLDIIPTLSNLFGLEYDSRLLMGRDILSDAEPLVIFNNRSWITDKANYNSITDVVTYTDKSKENTPYSEEINRLVEDKFKYSARMLETDYYRHLLAK